MFKAAFLCGLLVLAPLAASIAPPVSVQGKGGPKHILDQLIVSFHPGVTEAEIQAFYKKYGLAEDDDLDADKGDDDEEEKVVRTPAKATQQLIDRLNRDSRTEYVEFNYIIELALSPNDPQLSLLWGLNNTGQTGGTADADIDAPEAWEVTTGSSNVIVGIIDTGLTNGTTYFYVVTARDDAGNESAKSAEISGAPVADVTPPDAPTGLVATGGDLLVQLSWDDNDELDLIGYRVYLATSSGGPYAQVATRALSNYTGLGLSHGVTYYYVVTAIDLAANESGNSNQASATALDLTAPTAPTGLIATSGNREVGLDWADNTEPDLASYRVYRSDNAGGLYSQIAVLTMSNYTDTGLTKGTTYYYVIAAMDDAGNEGDASAQVNATTLAIPAGSATLTVINGWNSLEKQWLEEEKKTYLLQTSDNLLWPGQYGGYNSFQFSDVLIPAGATISSVKIFVEHLEEDNFGRGGLEWQVGTGWPAEPTVWATNTAIPLNTKNNEATDSWDITAYVDTPSKLNSLELYIGNLKSSREKTQTDYVYVVVEWSS